MAAAKVKADEDATMKDEIDLTLYDATPEPENAVTAIPPSFKGRLNLNEFAFRQPTNPLRTHRLNPKIERSSSDAVKKEQNSPRKGPKGSRRRPLVLTPTPEPDDARITVKKEVKVEREVHVVTAPASESEHVATSAKVGKVEPNSPIIAPIQCTEWDLPIIKVQKPEPCLETKPVIQEGARKRVRHTERVVIELDDSSPEPEGNVRSAAPTPSTNAPSREATAGTQSTASPASGTSASAATNPSPTRPTLRGLMADSVASAFGHQSSPESLAFIAAEFTSEPPASGMVALSPAPARSLATTNARSPLLAATEELSGAPSTVKRKHAVVATSARAVGSAVKKDRKPRKPKEKYSYTVYPNHKPLKDIMGPNMIGVIVGTNPGLATSEVQHTYAAPTNKFWQSMYMAGITDRQLSPYEDGTLPEKYQMGNTNIVDRPTRNEMELSQEEMAAGIPILEEKIKKWKPECVFFVGAKNYRTFYKAYHGRNHPAGSFTYGWKPERLGAPSATDGELTTDDGRPWRGARVYACTSTSGLNAGVPDAVKNEAWGAFGMWLNNRRRELGLPTFPSHYPDDESDDNDGDGGDGDDS